MGSDGTTINGRAAASLVAASLAVAGLGFAAPARANNAGGDGHGKPTTTTTSTPTATSTSTTVDGRVPTTLRVLPPVPFLTPCIIGGFCLVGYGDVISAHLATTDGLPVAGRIVTLGFQPTLGDHSYWCRVPTDAAGNVVCTGATSQPTLIVYGRFDGDIVYAPSSGQTGI